MKVNLFSFQQKALQTIRKDVFTSIANYRRQHVPQIVSYTAPTGAGKTIIMSALIETIFEGDEYYPDQPDAIFVWLSDSPQLNEQSKLKIDTKADRIRLGQCVTISDDSFDRELLEDGHIYFLNTQKLSKSSNLTKHSDGRQYTIWETLANTIHEKSDRLYFIIDEAHRGAQKSTELARATTIMQKFLKGSPDDHMPPMPVVIGMTATSARFNRLAEGLQTTTVHYVRTTPDEVRASGLLKDRIVITYPETEGNDMAVLQAAADEWKNKWDHWTQYCFEQHYAYVNPVFVIQVENGTGNRLTTTDLDECLRSIEERTGERFSEGEVVHAFAEGTSAIQVNGLNVPYVEPSRIVDDKRIKIVFFKETLSTGWDCPRAETMMSFRRAKDHTYVAQLLGRMIRTPTQQHINVDETLNDVHLYLPQFNASTVYDVVEALKSTEGATIPTDVEAEEVGNGNYVTLGLTPTYKSSPRKYKDKNIPGQMSLFVEDDSEPVIEEYNPISDGGKYIQPAVTGGNTSGPAPSNRSTSETSGKTPVLTGTQPQDQAGTSGGATPAEPTREESQPDEPQNDEPIPGSDIDREAVVKAINDAGLLTYNVRKVRITDYLKSMYALARFLTQTRIDMDAKVTVFDDIMDKIRAYVEALKASGTYEELANQVMQFKMNAQVFDVFGESVENYENYDLFSTTDADIDRQFRLAEIRLGNEGISYAYLNKYRDEEDQISLKIDVILYAADTKCLDDLEVYAENKFHHLNDANRRRTVTLPERYKKRYDDIVSDGDIISKHNFRLPERIQIPRETEGKLYSDHLFVDDSGTCMVKLNGWETKLIEEEEKQEDFVCWLRNPSRGSWALCIPYEIDSEKKPTYPDFLVIREDGSHFVIDILEPHDPTRVDNLGKAKGFAEYARQNPGVGRIQLIRMKKDSLGVERPFRLDMSKSSVRDRILHCASVDELNHAFDEYGFFM